MSDWHLTPALLMDKASMACSSARALLDIGDVDGAANRAYHAMFQAARAALLSSGAPVVEDDAFSAHSGLNNAFEKYLVQGDRVSKDAAALLFRAHELCLVADYENDLVAYTDARDLVTQAITFVSTMQAEFLPGGFNLADEDGIRGPSP